MTNNETKGLTVAEQIKALAQTGYLKTQPTRDVSSNADTTSATSTDHSLVESPFEDTSRGHANAHGPTDFMLPRVPGLNTPSPTQTSGSNLPGSTIRQMPVVTLQQPGQVIPVPPVENGVRLIVPSNGEPFFEQTGTTPGRGNAYGPSGRISPRTAGGADANPLLGDNELPDALRQQLKKPVEKSEDH